MLSNFFEKANKFCIMMNRHSESNASIRKNCREQLVLCTWFGIYFSLWSPFKMAINGSIHYKQGSIHTVSSSFSMPVGISSTARLTAAKSINSGISSSLYTGIGLLASIARARNDSLLILAHLRRRMDASAVKLWQKRLKCLSNAHISFHLHIIDDVLSDYLSRNKNYALSRSADASFEATCNVTFTSIMATAWPLIFPRVQFVVRAAAASASSRLSRHLQYNLISFRLHFCRFLAFHLMLIISCLLILLPFSHSFAFVFI